MTREELQLIKRGGANLRFRGERDAYECVGEQKPLGLIFAPVEGASGTSRTITEDELLNNPAAQAVPLTNRQYIALVHKCDCDNKEALRNAEYAIALLQVKPDAPEKRDISFESYQCACKHLGEGKKPEMDMYAVMHVEPVTPERLAEIKGGYVSYARVGDYVFEKFNAPDTRPSVYDGYFGTSASVSNVVLIKEKDKMTALYIDSIGFKELPDFVKSPQKEASKKRNKPLIER